MSDNLPTIDELKRENEDASDAVRHLIDVRAEKHLLAIAEARHATKQVTRAVIALDNGPDIAARNAALRRLDDYAATEDSVYAAARAAGLFGEVGG